ncbi:unnamed protein product (macronuclear) [Paramecium tetraurelia]|uniref:Uncharacterized protein n=1 Tax=Paramecium tetraurelia TaxID=5888 RepID=A0D6V0_PARTE|nr:uncharacterized protein GSPATT00001808001 [Paramecium tetraurelia]CAK78767.1 unnamed protein product [Paramecium tetraurelia]|eukprot:XP_001446164.1 hypothetical protein (macronuclear) [Paramecium tetraurelia strain d4-2]
MQERYKEALLSPQFKDQDYDLSTQECRKFSSIWAAEFNTPETKYRSTIGANRIDISKDANLLHFRNRTAKFEDEQNQLYIEIQNLYDKRQFDIPNLVETKILYKTETVPNRFIIKRKQNEPKQKSQFNDQVLIEKMHQANKQSLKNLFSHKF